MAERKPLVLVDGKVTQLPVGDTLAGGAQTSSIPKLPIVTRSGSIAWASLAVGLPYRLPVTTSGGSVVHVELGGI